MAYIVESSEALLPAWLLRVAVEQDENGWFAQGIEVDYAVQGATRDEIVRSFCDGFIRTVALHLRIRGNVTSFLRPVAAGVMMAFNGHITSQSIHPFGGDSGRVETRIVFFEFYEIDSIGYIHA